MQKLAKDSRGVAHLALIAVIVVVVGAVGFAAWRVSQKDKDTGSSSNTDQSSHHEETEVPCESSDEDLCKFVRSFSKVKSYRMTASTTTDGKTSTSEIKVQLPDRFQMTVKDSEYNLEIITIGDDSYTKAGDTWWKSPPTSDRENPTEDYDFSLDDATAEELGRYKKLGKEACGSMTCFKYQYTAPGESDKQFFYFDDDDYLLRKVSSDGSEIAFSYEDVSVETPSPVKELGPNQYIMPGHSEPVTIPQ